MVFRGPNLELRNLAKKVPITPPIEKLAVVKGHSHSSSEGVIVLLNRS